MKEILSTVLILAACGLAAAADPVGTWTCEYTIGDVKRTSTLTIKKDGGTLSGTMTWADQKDEPLKGVKLADGILTFSATRKFMGSEFPVSYKLAVDGDTLKGKGVSESNNQKQEFTIEGQRGKAK
jgi:hypothetical protein